MAAESAAAGITSLIAPALNLSALVAILFWKLKGPARGFISSRHSYIREEVARVAEQLRHAQERHDEFSAKLKAIEAEITAIRNQARQDAEAAKLRILNEAKRLSATIVSDAQTSAQALYSDLRTQLRMDIGNRIIDRAEQLLRERLTTDDRARIRRDFSKQVEQIQ